MLFCQLVKNNKDILFVPSFPSLLAVYTLHDFILFIIYFASQDIHSNSCYSKKFVLMMMMIDSSVYLQCLHYFVLFFLFFFCWFFMTSQLLFLLIVELFLLLLKYCCRCSWKQTPVTTTAGLKTEIMCKYFHFQTFCDCSINNYATELGLRFFSQT